MFRSHRDTVRTPIAVEKPNNKPKALLDGYTCDLCGKAWLTETDVDIHRKKAHLPEIVSLIRKDKKHFCLICVRAQGSAEKLLSHIKSDHLLSSPSAERVERELFICDICEHVFFNKRLLLSHIQYLHRDRSDSNVLISCPKCNKSYKSHKIWFHFNFHQLDISSTCQICLNECTSKSQQREHHKTHPSYYHCETCNMSLKKKQFFDDHIKAHKKRTYQQIGGEMRRFFAPWSAVAPWQYKMESSIKGMPLYDLSICILCRHICTTIAEKRRHIFVDHAPNTSVRQKPMCVCGAEFFNMVLLKQHVFKLKGDHRILGEKDPVKSLGEGTENLGSLDSERISVVRVFVEEPSPMDCDLFTVQDLGV